MVSMLANISRYLIFLAFGLLVGCSAEHATLTQEFDKVCTIFDESRELQGEVGEIWYILGEKVEQQVQNTKVLSAYSALSMSDPTVRYRLFKEEVERVTGEKWDCKPMQAMLGDATD